MKAVQGTNIDVIYLDFAKAFDKVPHHRLLQKVKAHGINSKIWNWIRAWLTNRNQRVCIKGKSSTWAEVLSGVPQGSVLGPVLFLIYINDLEEGIENWILKFADDSKIFSRIQDTDDRLRLQKDLNQSLEWSREWQMKFNVEKCKVMHVGSSNPRYTYEMDGSEIQVIHEEKDLGVTIVDNLKTSVHCAHQYAKANRMLGLLRRTFKTRSKPVLLKMYKSVVRPHLEYCSSVWSPHYKKDKELLEKIQHRFTRLFKELRQLTYAERLHALGLWSLEERRNRADLEFFEFNTDRRTRGHQFKLNKRQLAKDIRLHFFSERVINRWNGLPSDVVSAKSLNLFKAGLQQLRDTQIDFFMDE